MSTTTDLRVIDTDTLRYLWRKAGDGKRPSAEFMESLDDEGLHTVGIALGFMGDDAREHRVEGYAKISGSDQPHPYRMDILVEDFNRLETLDSLRKRMLAERLNPGTETR